MKRIYWKEMLMLSAPVGLIALGLVFVRVRSNEPTQSLLSKWPDKTQITKCEVRPATPLEISQGADFGLTMQTVSPEKPRVINGLRYTAREPASKLAPKVALKSVFEEKRVEFRKAAHPLQQDYLVSQLVAGFSRRQLKSAAGVIEVDVKVGRGRRVYPAADKVFQLDTKTIPLPNAVATRKANFRITGAALANDRAVQLYIDDYTEEPSDLISFHQTVGKWTAIGYPDQNFEASIGDWSKRLPSDKPFDFVTVTIRYPKAKQPALEGRKFRGLISLNRGWPQEVTLEWPKKIEWGIGAPQVRFSTKLAPLPK